MTEPGVVLTDHAATGKLHDAAAPLHLATLVRNGRGKLQDRTVNAELNVYNEFRKRYYVDGQIAGPFTFFGLTQAVYPDIRDGADAKRKKQQLRRILRRLEAAGLVRITDHKTDNGQVLGKWYELVNEAPRPEAWPDLVTAVRRNPERAAKASRFCNEGSLPPRRGVALERYRKLRLPDRARRVRRWCPRIGHGAAPRYRVFFSDPLFGPPTSSPTPFGLRGADQVRERRAHAPARPRPWAALSRCRTAASGGGALAVLDVPRAGWPAMAAAAFERRFLADAEGSWWHVGDPWHRERPQGRDGDAWVADDAELQPPEHRHRYVTLSGPWTRRLETWCRTYDRAVRQPGAGIRSLVEDVADWQPGDGAPSRHDEDAGGGWPVSLAFFVARLGRRAKQLRAGRRGAGMSQRRHNMDDWALGDRW